MRTDQTTAITKRKTSQIIDMEGREQDRNGRRGTGGVMTEKVLPTSGHCCSNYSPCNIPVQLFSEDPARQTVGHWAPGRGVVAGLDWCVVPSEQAAAVESSSLLTQTRDYMQLDNTGTGASAGTAATSLPSTLN